MNELQKKIADIIVGYTFNNQSTEFDPDDLPDMTTDIINCVNDDNNRPMTFEERLDQIEDGIKGIRV
jgi:hypothetical protein